MLQRIARLSFAFLFGRSGETEYCEENNKSFMRENS
jgi:hypothetical protein